MGWHLARVDRRRRRDPLGLALLTAGERAAWTREATRDDPKEEPAFLPFAGVGWFSGLRQPETRNPGDPSTDDFTERQPERCAASALRVFQRRLPAAVGHGISCANADAGTRLCKISCGE